MTEGSYKGISLIDPIWVAPELSMDAASRPDAQDFYEPTWWVINGKKIHRTHFAIYRTGDLPDQLKPTYLFGGIPLPQQIFERVYAAERTANEAPQLAMTKRLTTLKMNTIAMGAQEGGITENVQLFTQMRDNYGVHVLGEEEDIQQFDISLADLDATIMTQYQLCAMIGELPATKLLGTTPKGFNATGEYDAKSYQEKLQGIQKNKLTKLVQRHHELIIKSIIMPKYGIDYFRTELVWKPIDTPTFEEVSKIQKSKAETYKTLFEVGAVDDLEIRSAVIKDPDSGFNGLDSELPPDAKPHGQEAAGG